MTCNVAAEIESAEKILTKVRDRLSAAFEESGGRGVELAEELDKVSSALAALSGDLFCPRCDGE